MASYFVNLSNTTNGLGSSRLDPFNSLSALPTLVAGDIVEIEPGTSQIMSGTYAVSGSGASNNPITIRANPAVTGPKPRFYLPAQGQVGLISTARSNVVFENLEIYGDPAWVNQDSVGVRINGSVNNIFLRGVDCRYCRIDLSGGFNSNNIQLINCSAKKNASDGVRLWSSTGTYTWSNISIEGGDYSENGTAMGANGAGISSLILTGHTGTIFENIKIVGVTLNDNYRAGIALSNSSVVWTTWSSAANTTPPTKLFRGVQILNNVIMRNGGAGVSVLGAEPSSTMKIRIANNLLEENSSRITLGNIWTGACISPLIEFNICRRAFTNGTTIGDGQGIFDDQWNDGAIVRYNLIEDNVYNPLVNPDYSSYGIGVYRCSNSKHYGNVISGCRHGYVIGTVTGATAPVMTGIEIYNNTFVDIDRYCISIWSATPSNSLTIKNNFLFGALQDVEAHASNSGLQTFSNNAALDVSIKYTGNNVGAGAVNHTLVTQENVTNEGAPRSGSPLLSAGANIGYMRDIDGKQAKSFIGAYSASTVRKIT